MHYVIKDTYRETYKSSINTYKVTQTEQNDYDYDCDSGLRLRNLYTYLITYLHTIIHEQK